MIDLSKKNNKNWIIKENNEEFVIGIKNERNYAPSYRLLKELCKYYKERIS